MKVTLKITDERRAGVYGNFQPEKRETYTFSEVDADLTAAATVGFLRALATSIEGEHA